ncbi:MAG: hypothetical protein GQ555_02580, partial [Desulfobacterales bacterium]|nr:hypothetical protein [Desulfobacterales bacterium]
MISSEQGGKGRFQVTPQVQGFRLKRMREMKIKGVPHLFSSRFEHSCHFWSGYEGGLSICLVLKRRAVIYCSSRKYGLHVQRALRAQATLSNVEGERAREKAGGFWQLLSEKGFDHRVLVLRNYFEGYANSLRAGPHNLAANLDVFLVVWER